MLSKAWIQAARLRTLPLAISGILMGSFMAEKDGSLSPMVLLFALLTASLLQILSNLANDLGDGLKGTDNENRIGPQRAIQSKAISIKAMKKAILVFSILSFFAGITTIWVSKVEEKAMLILFVLLGIACIWAAIKYTLGKGAYGYIGLGDLFVFIFFGLISVAGVYFLHTAFITLDALLPAASIGLLSAGVLNLNNMRDIKNDLANNKRTLATKLGLEKAKNYQVALVIGAMACMMVYSTLSITSSTSWLYVFSFPLLILHIMKVNTTNQPSMFDPMLKQLALTTLLLVLLFGIGNFIHL